MTRRLLTVLALACLAGCRVPLHPLPPAMVALQRPPREGDYREVGRYEEKFIPGYIHYHYGMMAQARYEKLVQQQRAQKRQTREDEYVQMEEKYREQKKLEHLDEAQKQLKKFLEINRAREAAAQGGQKAGASSAEVKRYLSLAHQRLAVIYFERKEYELALTEFEEVLRIDPQADNTWVNMGLCYWQQGKLQKAKEAIAEALKLNPNSLTALQARRAIEKEERRRATQEAREGTPPPHPQPDR